MERIPAGRSSGGGGMRATIQKAITILARSLALTDPNGKGACVVFPVGDSFPQTVGVYTYVGNLHASAERAA